MARELPILFSTLLVRAILDGRKTETRRVVRSRHHGVHPITHVCRFSPDKWTITGRGQTYERCPYGQPGDLLYVRETFCRVGDSVWYRASGEDPPGLTWTPSIHMPKAAARIWLRVTEVRVERVQDITEEGAKAEGVRGCSWSGVPSWREPFANLWGRINAKRGFGWDANPWVWVVAFEVVSTTGRPA